MLMKKVASLIASVTSSDLRHRLVFVALFCISLILISSFFFLLPPFNTSVIISPRPPSLTPSPSPASDPSPFDPSMSRDESSSAAVFFRNAPWKAAIGHWFSRCYEASTPFSLNEVSPPSPENPSTYTHTYITHI